MLEFIIHWNCQIKSHSSINWLFLSLFLSHTHTNTHARTQTNKYHLNLQAVLYDRKICEICQLLMSTDRWGQGDWHMTSCCCQPEPRVLVLMRILSPQPPGWSAAIFTLRVCVGMWVPLKECRLKVASFKMCSLCLKAKCRVCAYPQTDNLLYCWVQMAH